MSWHLPGRRRPGEQFLTLRRTVEKEANQNDERALL